MAVERSRLAWTLACGLLLGCGDGKPDLGEMCFKQSAVICRNFYACCPDLVESDFLDVAALPGERGCQAILTARCEAQAGYLWPDADEDQGAIDVAALEACFDAMVAPDGVCEGVALEPPWRDACDPGAWTIGMSPDGGPCSDDDDCAGETSWCNDGACVARRGEGEPCSGYGCVAGYYCEDICRPQSPEGGVCERYIHCLEGLRCESYVCVPEIERPYNYCNQLWDLRPLHEWDP